MLLLFAIASLVNSALLFLVEPMFAKMILPLLGGSPSVWNTCLFFFQASLLAGYALAHLTTVWLGVRHQAAMHVVLLFLALFTLPIGVPAGWPSPPVEQNPIPWLLELLLAGVGFPFLLISATTPTLQNWFAHTGNPSAKDPYFLYAASNLGSMLALLGYPGLMEPNFRFADQSWMWAVGYGVLILITLACALMLWISPIATTEDSTVELRSLWSTGDQTTGVTSRQRIRWMIYSFIPSSLTLGVTTHFTTDISPIPLFWVIPLALYLLTFVLVFARNRIFSHRLMARLMPFIILLLVLSFLLHMQGPLWLLISLHLLTFFVVAMVCHGELARSRPAVRHLTDFYLWISVGGVLGGLFNALLAPVIFNSLIEYPIVLVLACLLQPRSDLDQKEQIARWPDFIFPLALGLLVVGFTPMMQSIGLKPTSFSVGLRLGLPIVLCFSFRNRPLRFGLGIGAVLFAAGIGGGEHVRVLERARSFFGVYRVVVDPERRYHLLVHGHTNHGQQSLDPSRSKEPLSYFYRTGPVGQVFQGLSRVDSKGPVAIIGLGAGSMACYGGPAQQFTFYEIDPVVERVAGNPRYFTYLRDCPPKINIVLGDARLSLGKAPDQHYSLIVLDAFSSDAIPIHLLTQEAIKLYLTKLAEGGILAFHISNLYLDLRPVLGDAAQDLRLISLAQDDLHITETEQRNGKSPSQWVVMARNREDLAELSEDPRWRLLTGRPDKPVWTDDFSNILSIVRWQ